MIDIPDYTAGGTLIAKAIAAQMKLREGQTLFREPKWDVMDDRVICVYENGCTWDVDRNKWVTTLAFQARAGKLTEVHKTMRDALKVALNVMFATPVADRNGVTAIEMATGPRVIPRDTDGRVYVDATLIVLMNAPFDPGR